MSAMRLLIVEDDDKPTGLARQTGVDVAHEAGEGKCRRSLPGLDRGYPGGDLKGRIFEGDAGSGEDAALRVYTFEPGKCQHIGCCAPVDI